jgi:hypothetical protein
MLREVGVKDSRGYCDEERRVDSGECWRWLTGWKEFSIHTTQQGIDVADPNILAGAKVSVLSDIHSNTILPAYTGSFR